MYCKHCGQKIYLRKLDNGETTVLNSDGGLHKETCSGLWLKKKFGKRKAEKLNRGVRT